MAASVAGADVVILEDYNKGVLAPPVIRAALQSAEQAGIPVVVDPKFRHVFEYRGATVFKPNAFELTAALGMPIRADDDAWLEEARSRFELRAPPRHPGRGGDGPLLRRRGDASVCRPSLTRCSTSPAPATR